MVRDEGASRSFRIGVFAGWPVHLAVSQAPATAPRPQSFAVTEFVPNEHGRNVDVARIDTDHAGCHIDRLYLPEDHPDRTEDYSVQYATSAEAVEHFISNDEWRYDERRYDERRYDETHGLPAETRVYD